MIIDTSNAPCGPGSIPGLRPSEGRLRSIGGLAPPRLGRRRLSGAFVPSSADREAVARGGATAPSPLPPASLSPTVRAARGSGAPPRQVACSVVPSRVRAGLALVRRVSRAGRNRLCAGRDGGCLRGPRSVTAALWRPGGLRPSAVARGGERWARASASLRESRLRSGRTDQTASLTTSDRTRRPAEFKHITKRRKRN